MTRRITLIGILCLLLCSALSAQSPSMHIMAGEYFWDTDPGEGNGTTFAAADGALNETIETLVSNLVAVPTGTGIHTFNVRVQDVDSNWTQPYIMLVFRDTLTASARQISVVEAEYFWDTDPGQGSGTPMLATDGSFNESVEGVIQGGIGLPAALGAHLFSMRIKDVDNNWSPVFSMTVFQDSTGALPRGLNVVMAEYYWDTDPGQGNGSPMLALDGNLDESLETVFQNGIAIPSGLGAHTFNVRAQDPDGNWSSIFAMSVYRDTITSAPNIRPIHISQAEYFWDTDPGQGNGTPMLAVDGALNETLESLLNTGIALPAGTGGHLFSVRTQDVENNWSPVFSTTVTVDSAANPANRQVDLVQAEYFWDTDPGEGNGTPMLAADGTLDETIEALLNNGIGMPSQIGPHTFGVRVKDLLNDWSTVFTTVVHNDTIDPTLRDVELVEVEYFWDSDPGQGNGTTMFAVDGNVDEAVESLLRNGIDISSLSPAGPHLFSVRVKDVDNVWSAPFSTVVSNKDNFFVEDTILGPTEFCGEVPLSVQTYTIDIGGLNGNTYTWFVDGGFLTAGQGTGEVDVFWQPNQGPYQIRVQACNPSGCDTLFLDVVVHVLPTAYAGEDTTICDGGSAQLLATGGVQYVWSPSTGLNNSSIANPVSTVTTDIEYIVTVTDSNTCQSTDTVSVKLYEFTQANAGLDTTICVGDTGQLFATGGIEYVWGPATGLSDDSSRTPLAYPTVTRDYTVFVTDTNGCTKSDVVRMNVNYGPSVDAGPLRNMCIGDTIQLNASFVNTTYSWTPGHSLSDSTVRSPLAFPIADTEYFLTGANSFGCANTDSVTVNVFPLPNVHALDSLQDDTSTCYAVPIQLGVSGSAVSFSWTPFQFLNSRYSQNPIATITDTTLFFVEGTDVNGCKSIDSILVLVNPLPPADAGPDTSNCAGDSLQLLATGGISYSWSPTTFLDDPNIPNPKTSPSFTLDYTVTVTDTNGCIATDVVNVLLEVCGANIDRSIVEAEYFWDIDPGQGMGTPFPAADGNLDETVETLLQNGIIMPITTGPHTFNVRVKATDTLWGPVFTMLVEREARTDYNRSLKLVQAEFFWDTDPGQGNGLPLFALDGTIDEVVEGVYENGIGLPIAVGPHTFNVRVLDEDTIWSPVFTTLVERLPLTAFNRDLKLIEAEFFWDTDPGQGSGTPMLAEDGSFDEIVEGILSNGSVTIPAPIGSHLFSVRVRDLDSTWSDVFTTVVTTDTIDTLSRDVKLVQAEYFWDTDPGQGNATAMVAVDGAIDEIIESFLNSGIAMPATVGAHTFNVRVQDAVGGWSKLFTTIVHHDSIDVGTRDLQLVQAEYFWDSDPGQGNGNAMLAADGAIDEIIEHFVNNGINMPTTIGAHSFNVRVQEVDNSWSNLFTTMVIHDSITVGNRDLQLVEAEYFWDTDPGQGNGNTLLAADGNLDEIVEGFLNQGLSMPAVEGGHTFNVRVRDVDNSWSNLFTTLVVHDSITVGNRDLQLVEGEYFWDTDPGQGNGTPMLAADGSFNEIVEGMLRSGLSMPAVPGAHTFGVRVREIDNSWSKLFVTVVVHDSITDGNRDVNLVQAEYFWDTDPGQGNGTAIAALDGNIDEAVEKLFKVIDIRFLTNAIHTFNLRVQGVDGAWTPTFSTVVSIELPTIFTGDSIVGTNEFCDTVPGTPVNYSTDTIGTWVYDWQVTGGSILAGQGSDQVSILWNPGPGPHSILLQGCAGTYCDTLTETIVVHILPVANAGPDTVNCFGVPTPLQGSGGYFYSWAPTAGLSGFDLANPLATPADTTLYILTVTDVHGCMDTDSMLFTVWALPPADAGQDTMVCVGDTASLKGSGGILYHWEPAAVVSDPDSAQTLAFPPVDVTYVLTVTDTNGCVQTDEVTVFLDSVPPTLVCPANISVSTDSSLCTALVTYITPVATDNCQVPSTLQTGGLGTGSNFPKGTTTESFFSVDANGNTSTCSFTITVSDNEDPLITCPVDSTVNTDPGLCTTFFTYPDPIYSDNCPGAILTRIGGLPSNSNFPKGTNTVTWRARDAVGNQSICSFVVTVIDNENPVITCPANITVNNRTDSCSQRVFYSNPGLTDNCPSPFLTRIQGQPSGSWYEVGVSVITWTGTDQAGLTDTCSFTITVLDAQIPEIICPPSVTIDNDSGVCGAGYTYVPPLGTDNCPGQFTIPVLGLGPNMVFPVGTTTERYIVTDAAGNQDSCEFDITVLDVEPPVVTCPPTIIQQNDPDSCGAAINYPLPAITDNCTGSVLDRIMGPDVGGDFQVGTTTVIWQAIDLANNRDTCSFQVIINDSTHPEIYCPNDTTIANSTGICEALFEYTIIAFDNCPRDSLVITAGLPSGSYFPFGTTLNAYKIIDASNNQDSCSFSVTVIDTAYPMITCPANISVNNTGGLCGAIVPYTTPVGTDNCINEVTVQITGNGAGGFFNIGVTTETYVVTDHVGQTDTCAFTVTVTDNELPVIVCPQNITVNIDSGQCDAVVNYNIPVGADNCPGAITLPTAGLGPGATFPIGTTTEAYEVTDAYGNTANCSFTVLVIDNVFPVIGCPGDTTLDSDLGVCGALYTYTPPVGTDNCSGHSTARITGQGPGTIFPKGNTLVTYRVTDISGNQAACAWVVTVIDVEDPVITCPIDYTAPTAAGVCGRNYTYPNPQFTDNCPGAVRTQIAGLPTGSFFPVGITVNTFVVTDAIGRTDTCSFTVTIYDGQNPAITCPPNIVVSNDAGLCSAVVNYTAPIGSDNCSGSTTVQTVGLGSGATFPLGTTTETYVVSDTSGNSASCSFTVTVNDNEDPVITCPSNITLSVDTLLCTAFYTYTPPVGVDNCPGAVTSRIAGLGPNTAFPLGTTTERYEVVDAAGNDVQCAFTVTVVDDEAPEMICPANIVDVNDPGICGANTTYLPPVVNDNCGANSPFRIGGPASGTIFPVGTTTVTYQVTDLSGNVATCSFTVTISDTEPPRANCPANFTVGTDNGVCQALVNYSVTASDNCSGASASQISGLASGSVFPLGATTLTWQAVDAVGLRDTCIFVITVVDDEDPVIICSPNVTQMNDPGLCGAQVGWIPPVASDNCSGVVTTLTGGLPPGSFFSIGTHPITYTGVDTAGNSASCTFNVIVTDLEQPTIVCPVDTVIANDTGVCGAIYTYIPPVGVDNCPGPVTTQIAGLGSGATFPIGVTLEVYEVIDGAGIPARCTTFVEVRDTELPIANCPADIIRDNDQDLCGAVVFYNVPFSDNCPNPSLTMINGFSSGTIFPVDSTFLNFHVLDIHGNLDSCSFYIIVNDTQPPAIVCPTAIVINNDPNICGAAVNYTVTSSDNCGLDSLDVFRNSGPESGAIFPVGVTSVSWFAQDSTGLTDSCTFTVTVIDNTVPTITCPPNVTIVNDSGICGAAYTYFPPATADNCVATSVPTTVLTLGDMVISGYRSDDHDGFRFVVLRDILPGTIINFTDKGWLASGGFRSGEGTVTWTCTTPLSAGTQVILEDNLGGYANLGSVVFSGGFNLSSSGDQLIAYQGTLASPTLLTGIHMNGGWEADATSSNTSALPPGFTDGVNSLSVLPEIDNAIYDCSIITTATLAQIRTAITDESNWIGSNNFNTMTNCFFLVTPSGGPPPTLVSGLGSGATFGIGNNTETWTVSDPSGNTAQCSFVVTVVDSEAPIIVCPADTVVTNDPGLCSAVVTYSPPIGTDNCPGSATVLTGGAGTGGIFSVGTTVEQYTVTDGFGNSAICAFTVTVTDDEPPVANCKDHTVFLDANGNGSHIPADQDNNSTDNCLITLRSLSQSAWVCIDVGQHVVTLTVADAAGNTDSCTSIITVVDNVAPIANCQDITLSLDPSGLAVLPASIVNNVSSDACGVDTLIVSQDTLSCADVGSNTITLTVTDVNGNVGTCTANVTLLDTIPPVAVCQDITVYLDAFGQTTIAAADVDGGSTDTCGINSLNVNVSSFGCVNVGVANTVTLSVRDHSNNLSTCTANVTVEDTVPPFAVCRNITVQLNAAGLATIQPADVDAGSSDACGIGGLSVAPDSFTCANIGANTVVLTVTDNNGNVDLCNAQVVIQDNVNPIAVCKDTALFLNTAGTVSILAADLNNGSSDACGISGYTASLTTFGCAQVGPNTVVLTVTDNHGNSSTCNSIVTIQDTVSPIARCQDITVHLDANGNRSIVGADVDNGTTDNCQVDSLSVAPGSFTCANVGANTVTLSAIDVFGNTTTCTATATVIDTVPPVAICRNITVQLDGAGRAGIVGTDLDNASTDACGVASLVVSQDSFFCADVGANTVVLTITDVNGNSSTCVSTVTVVDNVPPVARCKDITIQLNPAGQASINAGMVDDGSSDACIVAIRSVNIVNFNCFDVGTPNPVILEVLDNNLNQDTCTAYVTVEDTLAPIANCTDATIHLDPAGNGSVNVSMVNNSSTDNCPSFSVALSGQAAYTCADVGIQQITLVATDASGNQDSCVANVTVLDTVPPVAICQDITLLLNTGGTGTIAPADVDNGSSDACGINNLQVSPNTFTCADAGPNTVTLIVQDNNSNITTCLATVTVEDTTAPVALCQDITVHLDANGRAIIVGADVDNNSVDSCGVTTLTVSPDTFTCANVGANTVTMTATDGDGNASTCTATVTVIDTVPPVAICTDFTLQLDAAGRGGLTGNDLNNGSSDACGIQNLAISQDSFFCADVGAHLVTLTVTDANGNTSNCTSTVTVEDNVPPVARCKDITIQLNPAGQASINAGMIDDGSTDACIVAIRSVNIVNFNCSDVGVANPVVLEVLDNNLNRDTCTANVTVIDTLPPVAVCKDATVQLNAAGNGSVTVGLVNNGSNDNCPAFTLSLSGNAAYSCADVGVQVITLVNTDASGNQDSCTANVTVIDTVPPFAVCQDITLQLDGSGRGGITGSDLDNNSTDACGIQSLSVSQDSFFCAQVGTSPVTLTVTDIHGNSSTCTANVTVIDTVPPMAICQDITLQLDGNGDASITVADIDNGSIDACGVDTVTVAPTTFTCANVGANTVVLTVTDLNGNSQTCTATVTVEDTVPPVAVCQNITLALGPAGTTSINPLAYVPGATDNCTAINVTAQNTFSCADTGTTSIPVVVADTYGNTTSCNVNVTIVDNFPPTAICQDVTLQLDANGQAVLLPADIDNGSSDACGVAMLSVSPDTFNCTQTGPNIATLTVTDLAGNTSTCSATITVQDVVDPVAVCQDLTLQLDGFGAASIVASDLDNGSTDNCSNVNLSASQTQFGCADVGANNIVLTVTDASLNTATCTAVVTVEDTLPPVALCQDFTLTVNTSGSATLSPAQVDGGSSDNCTIQSTSISQTTFICADAGLNPVTLTVVDIHGNSSTCISNVTVLDSCCNLQIALVAANDETCPGAGDGSIQVNTTGQLGAVTYLWSNGATTEDLTGLTPGTYTLVASERGVCTDTLVVTIGTLTDTTGPVAVCQDITVQVNGAGNVNITATDIDGGSNDNCGSVTLAISDTLFTCADLGNQPVTLTVDDGNGNTASCVANVTVTDTLPPIAVCQDITLQLDGAGTVTIDGTDLNNGSGDNCSVASLSVSRDSFFCADIGAHTVILTVTDGSGNASTCTATVTVVDLTPPIAVCRDLTLNLDSNGVANITVNDIDNGSSDNCAITGSSLNDTNFDCSDIGTNAVILSITDGAGLNDQCIATVTIRDVIAPIARCQDITVILGGAGTATILPQAVDNGSSDNCGISSLFAFPTTFTCGNVGTNTVNLLVFDGAGLQGTCQANVTVEDTLPPVAVCQDLTVALDGNGDAVILPNQIDNGSNDVCTATLTLTLNDSSFTCADVGIVPVTLTATDATGNTAQCAASVTVIDTLPPVAICQDFTISIPPTGSNVLVAADINGGSTDNCGIQSVSINADTFYCADAGVHPVTLSLIDIHGNASNCVANVTVIDSCCNLQLAVASVIQVSCPNDNDGAIDVITTGQTAQVTYVWSTGDTTEDLNNIPAGTYTLVASERGICFDTLVVVVGTDPDTTAPVAVCQDVTVALDSNGVAVVTVFNINNGSFDNCTSVPFLNLNSLVFNCTDLGVNPVILTVTDSSANASQCAATVTIIDSVAPVASCQDITIQLDSAGAANLLPAQVNNGSSDACGIANQSVFQNSFTCVDIGVNTVVLTVSDPSGNADSCVALVTINDTIPAGAVCRDVTLTLDGSGVATLSADSVYAGFADNCLPLGISIDRTDFGCNDLGIQTVVLTVVDTFGNSTICTANVNVVPDFCQSDTVIYVDQNCAVGMPDFVAIANQNICSSVIGYGDLVSGGSGNTIFALSTDSTLWAWGRNNSGQLGVGNQQDQRLPVQVGLDSNWVYVSAGRDFSHGIKVDGTMWAWGAGKYGKLGVGANANLSSPVAVGADTDWAIVANGGYHALALKSDGSLWSWGRNIYGQLGDGTNGNNNTPEQVGTDTDWIWISASDYHSMALKADGTMWAWGRNNYGQLGIGTTANVNLPTQVGTDMDWVEVVAGWGHSVARKSDGTVWTFGRNNYGQLGDGTTTSSNSPTQEATAASDWEQINCGIYFTTARKVDGSIWSWGRNNWGQIGDGTLNTTLVPIRESSQQNDWRDLANGLAHTSALRNDGKIYGWGWNSYGQMGNGTTARRVLSPAAAILPFDMGPAVIDSLAIVQNPPPGTALAVGTSTVTLNANSISGMNFTCDFTVTVLDTSAPIFSGCPADTIVFATQNDPDPAVFWIPPTAVDNCGPVTMTASHQPGVELVAGQYTVTYTGTDIYGNTSGCDFLITVVPAGQLPFTLVTSNFACGYEISCNGAADGTIDVNVLSGVAPYTALWNDGNTDLNRTNLGPGTYSVTVTDNIGTTGTATVTLTEPNVLAIDTAVGTVVAGGYNLACWGDETAALDASASGGADCQAYTWNWTGPNGFTSMDQDIDSLGAGMYILTVTDANGCSAVDTFTLVQPDELVIDSLWLGFPGCGGPGQIELYPGGGRGYNEYRIWGPVTAIYDTVGIFSALAPGTYYLSIEDTLGSCLSPIDTIDLAWVGVIAPYTVTDESGPGLNDGAVTFAAPTNGVPPYEYSIDGGVVYQPSPVFSGLTPGEYHLIVRDSNDCKSILQTDTVFGLLDVQVNVTPNTCYGEANALASAVVTFGTAPYSYAWPNTPTGTQTSQTASGLMAGTYSVTIADASGFYFGTATATVIDPTPVTFTYTHTDETVANANDGSITFTNATGGTAPYLYGHQEIGATSPTIQPSSFFPNMAPGTYYLAVLDALNCLSPPPYQLVTILPGPTNKEADNGIGAALERDGMMLEAFPNPFRESTTIRFRVAKAEKVHLEIFSVTGVRMASLYDGEVESNTSYSVEFSPETLSDGVYFATFTTASGKVLHYKLVLIR